MSAMSEAESTAVLFDRLQEHWLSSFLLNVAGYGVVVVPAALLVRWLKTWPAVRTRTGPFYSLLRCCVLGDTQDELQLLERGELMDEKTRVTTPSDRSELSLMRITRLVVLVVGLQLSYITWGILQERIMTGRYDGDRFTNSQFLVFSNRILALCVSGVYLAFTPQPRHAAPFYKYSYASLSNVMSSWCQYEALKFVSFPTQVLAKSCKVIAVMLMGKVVSNKSYSLQEYLTAALISFGVAVFLLAADPSDHHRTAETTLAGVIILLGYLLFDSFTSNWQAELFRYNMSTEQMMFGINVFSSLLTMISLLLRGSLFPSVAFLFNHWQFALHTLVLSMCSAFGQIFIYHTIKQFGPTVFALIMTCRQAISILTSCILYNHVLSAQALLGLLIVFGTLFLKLYLRKSAKTQPNSS